MYARVFRRGAAVLVNTRKYSRKNDRITSSEDLVRLTGNASSDNFAKKWSSALDPIGGGRKHTPNHIQKQPFSNKKRQTPPHKQKYTQEDSEEHVYGVSPVYIALLTGRRDITEAFIQEGLLDNLSKKKKDPAVVKKIVQLCEQRKIPISHVSKHSLNMMTDNKPHQGLVLRASYLTPTSIASLPRVNTFKCVLALDEVTDPQNLGALIRSYYFLSRQVLNTSCGNAPPTLAPHPLSLNDIGVVLCQKNSAPLSPAVSKASSGALENMNIHSTKNMMKFLELSKENGWHVVGTSSQSMSREVIPLHDLPLEKSTPIIVVLGNEGYGVRKNILNRCETLVTITSNAKYAATAAATKKATYAAGNITAMQDSVIERAEQNESCSGVGSGVNSMQQVAHVDLDYVDSLNVSVCGGIILHHILLNSSK